MDIQELKTLWKSCDEKLDKAIALNQSTLKELKFEKANSKMTMFKVLTWAGLLSALAWIVFIGWIAFNLRGFTGFAISAGGIMLVAIIGVTNYVYQLHIASQFDYSEGIAEAQSKLAKLELSLLKNVRIMFLQAPFYSTFYLSADILANASPLWLIIQVLVTGGLTFGAIWFYVKVSPGHMHYGWVSKMADSFGLRTLRGAMNFLNEIEDFKHK